MCTLKQLSDLDLEAQHKARPNFPKEYLVRTKFVDTTANGLTEAVVTFLNLSGHRADRISSSGRYIDDSKIVTDVTGAQRVLGKGKWIKGQTRKGYSDINSTIFGFSVQIEIKMKDKVSKEQIAFAEAERKAGGQYWVVRSFEEFIKNYTQFVEELNKV